MLHSGIKDENEASISVPWSLLIEIIFAGKAFDIFYQKLRFFEAHLNSAEILTQFIPMLNFFFIEMFSIVFTDFHQLIVHRDKDRVT